VQCFSAIVTPEAVPLTRVYIDAEIGLTGISRPARIIVEWAPPPCFSPTLIDMKWWRLQNFGGFSYYINSICVHRLPVFFLAFRSPSVPHSTGLFKAVQFPSFSFY
jgi:hypothetical protein